MEDMFVDTSMGRVGAATAAARATPVWGLGAQRTRRHRANVDTHTTHRRRPERGRVPLLHRPGSAHDVAPLRDGSVPAARRRTGSSST